MKSETDTYGAIPDSRPSMLAPRAWQSRALAWLGSGDCGMADVAPVPIDCPALGPDIRIYLKDESRHASGSLKHRLALALFTDAIATGRIEQGMRKAS